MNNIHKFLLVVYVSLFVILNSALFIMIMNVKTIMDVNIACLYILSDAVVGAGLLFLIMEKYYHIKGK